MEATLLPIYGTSLPEDWRRFVSFRRLLTIFRWADDDTPMRVALRGRRAWRVEHQLVDELRQVTQVVAGIEGVRPHPLSPFHETDPTGTHASALADAKRRAEARARMIKNTEVTS